MVRYFVSDCYVKEKSEQGNPRVAKTMQGKRKDSEEERPTFYGTVRLP
jgi:hypothetical protein